jgi:hypothetical protein
MLNFPFRTGKPREATTPPAGHIPVRPDMTAINSFEKTSRAGLATFFLSLAQFYHGARRNCRA